MESNYTSQDSQTINTLTLVIVILIAFIDMFQLVRVTCKWRNCYFHSSPVKQPKRQDYSEVQSPSRQGDSNV